MKRSSPPLQFFATAATSAEASTRPSYRGARSQMSRRFSDQSSSVGDGRYRIFTRDSHFLSASDANQGIRTLERTNYDNQFGYRAQARLPVYNPQCHFIPTPHWYTTHPVIPPYFIPHPPSFCQNQRNRPPQQLGPRPSKPLDYRNWESAKLGPPPPCERFKVLSYNILADYLAMNHRSKLYFHIPEKMLEWEWRKKNIIFELGLWSADILCFQEVDQFQDLEEELKLRGYNGIWKMRTGVPVDGCAIFWRVSRFKLLHEECIEFNKLGLRDNVAQICVLESLNQNNNKDMSALPLSLTGSNKVVICNIHVLYNPKRGEIKLGQIRVLLDRAHAVSKLWDDAPVILSGDFNCTPKSPLYNYISEQKLNLSDLPRDKLSGQASAVIRPPKQFRPNIRPHAADSRGGASVVVDHRELSQSSPLDVQQNSPERISVNLASINSLSQPQCVKTGSNVDANNPSSGQRGSRNDASSAELTKRTHQEVDGYKDELTSMDYMVDEKMENLPLKEHPETDGGDEICAEDSTNFLSELHGGNESFSSDLSHAIVSDVMESDESCMETEHDKSLNFRYDPSKWTPMEIETATGDADCTLVEHSLKLSSTYTEAEDCSGTRDSNGEPLVTSYNRCFLGTVDYIWRSEGLQTVRVLAPIPKHVIQWTQGFPTKKWGSDHIALISELAFVKDGSIQNS